MKIKSCPICGDVPVIKVQPIRGYEPAVNYIINCSNIECPLFSCIQTCSTVYNSAAEAERKVKEKWNNYCYHVESMIVENLPNYCAKEKKHELDYSDVYG